MPDPGRLTAGVALLALTAAAPCAAQPARASLTVSAQVLDPGPVLEVRAGLAAALRAPADTSVTRGRLAQIRVVPAPADPRRRIATVNFLAN